MFVTVVAYISKCIKSVVYTAIELFELSKHMNAIIVCQITQFLYFFGLVSEVFHISRHEHSALSFSHKRNC